MAQGDNIGIPLVTDATDTSNSDQFAWSQKATNTLLGAKAPTANPTFTGVVNTPNATIAADGDINSTQIEFLQVNVFRSMYNY